MMASISIVLDKEYPMQVLPYERRPASFKPWSPVLLRVAAALIEHIKQDWMDVMHIGSTSAQVGGKGVIDLSVLYPEGRLQDAVEHLYTLGFQDQHSHKPFPPERPRKDGAVEFEGERFMIHVHLIRHGSEEHRNQQRFRDRMLANPDERAAYEACKREILAAGVTEQEAYGKLKGGFVKQKLAENAPD